MTSEWTTIESDPGVFTELLERMGARGAEVAELWSSDRESLAALEPVLGLIFLFKWQKEEDARPVDAAYAEKGIFFAAQVVTNACATQALVSVLLNAAGRPGLALGDELAGLRDFCVGAALGPEDAGLALGNSAAIRGAHNSFRPPAPPLREERDDDPAGEAFHFVAYVPAVGGLYELDGLKAGPIRLCDCAEDAWLDAASAAVSERIARYSATEQRFNLMAVVRSRRDALEEQLAALDARRAALALAAAAGDAAAAAELAALEGEAGAAGAALAAEGERRARWADENVRRRTDYIPFAFNLLEALAASGSLTPLLERAGAERRAKAGAPAGPPQ